MNNEKQLNELKVQLIFLENRLSALENIKQSVANSIKDCKRQFEKLSDELSTIAFLGSI